MSIFNIFRRKKPTGLVYNKPNKARAKNDLHSVGDVHDYLKEKYNAQLDIEWVGGKKRARLHLPDGSVIVGEGETHETATGALLDKLGGL